jgi:hypothetical protein
MACPDCGSSLGEFRFATSIETHGLDCGPFERFDQEFIVCRDCGGRFDVSDWDDTPELSRPTVEVAIEDVCRRACPAVDTR